jgi:hypothetical protein
MIRLIYNKTCVEITATQTNNLISETLFHVGNSTEVESVTPTQPCYSVDI